MPFSNLSLLVDPGNSTRTQPDAGSAWGRSNRWVDISDWQYGRICVGGSCTTPVDGTVTGGIEWSLDGIAWTRPFIPATYTLGSTQAVIVTDWSPVDPNAIAAGSVWIRSWYSTAGSASVTIALQFLDFQFR